MFSSRAMLSARALKGLAGRRGYIKPAYDLAKKIMPNVSATERAALNAGTVGFDGELFEGSPSLKNLVKKYNVSLTAEEQAFMDVQVTKACSMMDDYTIMRDRDMPEHVWEYLKKEK